MIADAVGGNADNFSKMMNDKLASLGLKNSNFITPNGLHDANHYTTAYDLSVIGREAYKNDWVKEAMNTKDGKIQTSTGAIAFVENRNKLLGQNGAIGGKTGYTSQSGRCLVALYERNGRGMVGVVMKSEYNADDTQVFKDMETIIDWSYNAAPVTLYEKGKELKTEAVTYKAFKFFGPEKTINVPVIINDEVTYYDNAVNKTEVKTEISLSGLDPWKLAKDSKIGKVDIKQREAVKTYDLYTTVTSKDLINANKGLYTLAAVGSIVALGVIVLIFVMISKGLSRGRRRNTFRYK
jgi:D-alanyl-D-alanine carboxypeptidase